MFWSRLHQLLRPRSALQAAVNVVGANKDDANDTARQFLRTHLSRGFKANVLLALWRFLRESTLAASLRTDGHLLSVLLGLCGPEAADVIASSMHLRPLNACWLPVPLMDLTRMILSRAPQALGYVVGIRLERPTNRPSLSEIVDLRVISGDDLVPSPAVAERAGVPHADGWSRCNYATHRGGMCCSCREVPRIWSRYARTEAREKSVIALQGMATVALTGDGVNDILALRGNQTVLFLLLLVLLQLEMCRVFLANQRFCACQKLLPKVGALSIAIAIYALIVKTVYAALALYCVLRHHTPLFLFRCRCFHLQTNWPAIVCVGA